MILIINKNAPDPRVQHGDILEYVGRNPPSPLRNPYPIGKKYGGRARVIERFRQDLWNAIKPGAPNSAIKDAMIRLTDANLAGRKI